MKKLLQEIVELENKVDKLYLVENTELFNSIIKTLRDEMVNKKKETRQDKFTRSRLELFNAGTKILEMKKKIKDKDVKKFLDTIGFAIYEVANDKSL